MSRGVQVVAGEVDGTMNKKDKVWEGRWGGVRRKEQDTQEENEEEGKKRNKAI
jgi:hypothetical protein